MSRPPVNNVILNGFDRSGASAIARTLALHPDVELIMQPFNSGPIRRKLYRIFDSEVAEPDDVAFFTALERNRLDLSYIRSPWHEKHSTVRDFVEGRLHVLKTTLNHFTIAWLHRRFPRLEIWGVWREPMDILASLVRNGFHRRWYRGAIEEIAPAVRASPLLAETFGPLLERIGSDVQQAAFLIAVRTYFFFHHLEPGKRIVYEEFLRDRNLALDGFRSHFRLAQFDFAAEPRRDLNITGGGWRPERRPPLELADGDEAFCREVFESLDRVRPG